MNKPEFTLYDESGDSDFKNKSARNVLSEEATKPCTSKFLWDENLLKSWPAQMLLGKFISLISFFKEQEYNSGFADGFPIASLFTVTVSVWVKEKMLS